MDERYQSLLELEELDRRIQEAGMRLDGYEPQLQEIEEPVLAMERELEAMRGRLEEMKQEIRRLERAADDKRLRLQRCEERVQRVRNPREEAAARTELDLVRRALEADEEDAIALLDQIKRQEMKSDELANEAAQARARVAPARDELVRSRQQAEDDLAVLNDRRHNHKIRMDQNAFRLYERVKAGRTQHVLARLMPDGACGNCFSLVPLQQQTEIRQGRLLARCEACGVIIYPEE